jgi:hypothetical protein
MTLEKICKDISKVKFNQNEFENNKITLEDYFIFLTKMANKYNIKKDFDKTSEGVKAFEQYVLELLIMLGVAI